MAYQSNSGLSVGSCKEPSRIGLSIMSSITVISGEEYDTFFSIRVSFKRLCAFKFSKKIECINIMYC